MIRKQTLSTALLAVLVFVSLITLKTYTASHADINKQTLTPKRVASPSQQIALLGNITEDNMFTNTTTQTTNVSIPLQFKPTSIGNWHIFLPHTGLHITNLDCQYDGTNDGYYNAKRDEFRLLLNQCSISGSGEIFSVTDNPSDSKGVDANGNTVMTGFIYLQLHGSYAPWMLVSIIGKMSPWPPQ